MDILVCILVFGCIGLMVCGWKARHELKQTVYWKKLPGGTAIFGYSLPIILLIIGNDELGFIQILISILLVVFFIYCLIQLNKNLKEKPLEGFSTVLPDDIRKKVVFFNAMTPLMTVFVFMIIYMVYTAITETVEYAKGKDKKKK